MDSKPGKKWECSQCTRLFDTYNELTIHMASHDPDAKVKCQMCGKFYKSKFSLSRHVSRFHSHRKRPSCDTCHREFSTPLTLRGHIDAVHSTKERSRFPCRFPGCEKTYQNRNSLWQHVNNEHADNPVRFPCTLCEKDFRTRAELGQHIRTHTKEKPFNCATCGGSFTHKGHVKSHERTHLEKSTRLVSKCHICLQTFLSKTARQHHIRVAYEDQRNYPCTFCDKRFVSTTDLKRHVEAVHATNKELIHSCDKCEYKSHSKYNLAAHRIRHDAVKHECYFCLKKLLTSSELVRHCRVHTFEK